MNHVLLGRSRTLAGCSGARLHTTVHSRPHFTALPVGSDRTVHFRACARGIPMIAYGALPAAPSVASCMPPPSPISRPSQPAAQLGAIPRPQLCLSARGCAEIRLRARAQAHRHVEVGGQFKCEPALNLLLEGYSGKEISTGGAESGLSLNAMNE